MGELPLATFMWLLLLAFAVSLGAEKLRVPYAPALAITGLVAGLFPVLKDAVLSPHLLLSVLLPSLLFEGALHISAASLKRDLLPVSILATVGTVAAALFTAWLLQRVLHLPEAACLAFGCLIAATDPISVIALFRRIGAPDRLTLIVEAESLLNDGMAAALYMAAVGSFSRGTGFTVASVGIPLLIGTLGGALVGGALGWVASRIHSHLDDPLMDLTLTALLAYGSYLVSSALNVSGVIAVIAAGLVAGNLGLFGTMSDKARDSVVAFWEFAAFVANSMVFLLVGFSASRAHWLSMPMVVLGAIVSVLFGRLTVYPLLLISSRAGGRVPANWCHVLWWGGLRGALSLALALALPAGFPDRNVVISATFGVVIFSLIIQGLTINLLVVRLNLAAEKVVQAK